MNAQTIKEIEDAIKQGNLDMAYELIISLSDPHKINYKLLGNLAVRLKKNGLIDKAIKILKIQAQISNDPGIQKLIHLWQEDLQLTDKMVVQKIFDFLRDSLVSPYFSPKKADQVLKYLDICLKVYNESPDTNLKRRTEIYNAFSTACQNLISKRSQRYLYLALSILLAEDYDFLLRQFLIDQLRELFRNSRNVIPNAETKETKIDSVLKSFRKFVTLTPEDKKSLVEYVRRLLASPLYKGYKGNSTKISLTLSYLDQLARLWIEDNSPKEILFLMHRQIKNSPNLFIPLAFDFLYFWDEPEKCLQIVLSTVLDTCLKQRDHIRLQNRREYSIMVQDCYNFLCAIEKQLAVDLQPSITDSFREQIIRSLTHYHYSSYELSYEFRIWIGELAAKLFPEHKEEIDTMCKVASIEGLPGERWIFTVFDICVGSNPRHSLVRYLFDLVKVNLIKQPYSETEITSLIEMCRKFFKTEEIDMLVNELLTRLSELDQIDKRIKTIISLLPKDSLLQHKLLNEFMRYRPYRSSCLLEYHRICLTLLLSSTCKDPSARKAIQTCIRLLFENDILKSPDCPEELARENLSIVQKLQDDTFWK